MTDLNLKKIAQALVDSGYAESYVDCTAKNLGYFLNVSGFDIEVDPANNDSQLRELERINRIVIIYGDDALLASCHDGISYIVSEKYENKQGAIKKAVLELLELIYRGE